ncbi:MAG TPA: rhodanese-like domain-containing protein [Povalibacter sp.]
MFARLIGLKTISPAALQELMQQKAVSVVDVNSDQSWIKAHVPGAKHLDVAGYAQNDLPSNKDSFLVFYCSNSCAERHPTPPTSEGPWLYQRSRGVRWHQRLAQRRVAD